MKECEIFKMNKFWGICDFPQIVDMHPGFSGIREGKLQF